MRELEGNLANSINVYAAGCRTEDSGCEVDGKILKAAIMFPVYALLTAYWIIQKREHMGKQSTTTASTKKH